MHATLKARSKHWSAKTALDAHQLFRHLNESDEHSRIEAKSIQRGLGRSILETVCAYSNEPGLGGGHILIGVAPAERMLFPSYEVLGLSDPESVQADLATQCASGVFNQAIRPRISIETVKKRQIVVAFVPEVAPNEKPVYFKKDGLPSGAYRRIGPTDQRCTDDDLVVFYQGRQVDSFDVQIVPDARMEHLDAAAITEYRNILKDASPDAEILRVNDSDMLLSMGCARERDGAIVPTVAGIVLFGTQAAIRRFFPALRIDYIISQTREWVKNPTASLDHIAIQDSLVRAVVKLRKLVLGDLVVSSRVPEGTLQRSDETVLPERVIREAIVNAVMHRSYRANQPIQVIRYPNRLEIRNPGYSLKAEELFGKPGSQQRNPRIATVLHELKLAETKGMGVGLMQRIMVECGLAPPYLESNRAGDQFTAFFLFHHFLGPEDLKALSKFKDLKLADDEPRALVFAKELGAIDVSAYRSFSGLDALSASTSLRRLRTAGLLERRDQGSTVYYVPTNLLLNAWIENQVPEESAKENEQTPPQPDKSPAFLDSSEHLHQGHLPALPERLEQALNAMPRRPPASDTRRVILQLCAWRPMRGIELAAYLGYKTPHYLRDKFLTPLITEGLLGITTDSIHSPHLQYKTEKAGLDYIARGADAI